jgi:hypothetical protein
MSKRQNSEAFATQALTERRIPLVRLLETRPA